MGLDALQEGSAREQFTLRLPLVAARVPARDIGRLKRELGRWVHIHSGPGQAASALDWDALNTKQMLRCPGLPVLCIHLRLDATHYAAPPSPCPACMQSQMTPPPRTASS